jgi:DNA-directed RNA polymerase specialized sigma24 family protein
VFLAALASLGNFRGASSLKSWLLGIARHKVEDYITARGCASRRRLVRKSADRQEKAEGQVKRLPGGAGVGRHPLFTKRPVESLLKNQPSSAGHSA